MNSSVLKSLNGDQVRYNFGSLSVNLEFKLNSRSYHVSFWRMYRRRSLTGPRFDPTSSVVEHKPVRSAEDDAIRTANWPLNGLSHLVKELRPCGALPDFTTYK